MFNYFESYEGISYSLPKMDLVIQEGVRFFISFLFSSFRHTSVLFFYNQLMKLITIDSIDTQKSAVFN